VEHCGLCGIAHLGYSRVCPHLNSEEQILSMLQSLRQSTEPKWLVDSARHYLYNVKGDLVKRKKAKADPNRPTSAARSTPSQPNISNPIFPNGRAPGAPVSSIRYPPPSASNPFSNPYLQTSSAPSSSSNGPPTAPHAPGPSSYSLPTSNGFKQPASTSTVEHHRY
jgi:hypothetical protein